MLIDHISSGCHNFGLICHVGFLQDIYCILLFLSFFLSFSLPWRFENDYHMGLGLIHFISTRAYATRAGPRGSWTRESTVAKRARMLGDSKARRSRKLDKVRSS